MQEIGFDEWLARLRGVAGAFARALDQGDLGAPVSTCPGWTLQDLGNHLGWTHHWAVHGIRAGTPDGDAALPAAAELPAWYAERAGELGDVLEKAGPVAPCWHFGPKPRLAGFWARRQVHEAAVHLWDADRTPIDAAAAQDGVDEVIDVFYPRQVRLGRTQPVAGAVRLRPGDGDRILGDGDPVVTVSGPADDVLLMLWGRRTPDGLQVEGDRGALDAALAASIVP